MILSDLVRGGLVICPCVSFGNHVSRVFHVGNFLLFQAPSRRAKQTPSNAQSEFESQQSCSLKEYQVDTNIAIRSCPNAV